MLKADDRQEIRHIEICVGSNIISWGHRVISEEGPDHLDLHLTRQERMRHDELKALVVNFLENCANHQARSSPRSIAFTAMAIALKHADDRITPAIVRLAEQQRTAWADVDLCWPDSDRSMQLES